METTNENDIKSSNNLTLDKINKNKAIIKHESYKKVYNNCDNKIKNKPKWIDKELN